MNPDAIFEPENQILQVIAAAKEFIDIDDAPSKASKPRLLIEDSSPDCTVAALRDILATDGELFDRGVPVRLVRDPVQNSHVAHIMSPDGLILKTHTISRPYKLKPKTDRPAFEVDARLPKSLAMMYLDWRGEWGLRPLNGIASVPLLREDGSIFSDEGYDVYTGMWLENMPDLTGMVPQRPTLNDARTALQTIRDTFKTFCFSDACTVYDANSGGSSVDISAPPGRDESAFLHALLTAVARPSLHLAPGVVIRAPSMSGAGAGKGLLARCICMIAYGHEPHAVTGGVTNEEIEKRIAAELMGGSSALFLDNLNNTNFKSDLLASAITERPARVRLLGRSQMVNLNTAALVIMTGNGLSVSEDLARRFLMIELDPRTENPEARSFESDIRENVKRRRKELLAALLTIWRWGRFEACLLKGLSLGSFEQWCKWVRDPLLTLGCQDPAERVAEAKERDGRRQAITALFEIWWKHHGDQPVAASKLHDEVKLVIDPHNRGRQYLSSFLEKLDATRMAGFVFARQASAGHWGTATYTLKKTGDGQGHRDHRGHSNDPNPGKTPFGEPPPSEGATQGPMPPMPLPLVDDPIEPAPKKSGWSLRI